MATISQHLESIRQKPEHIKKHIAFWSSLCITLGIVLFWIASLSFSFTQSSSAATASNVESPWHAMAASASDAWNTLKTSVGASAAVYQAPPVEVTPGK